MDTQTIEPIDTTIVDDRTEIEDTSFGKEIAKTLILSAATTAGMIGGLFVVGLTANKVTELRQNRRIKKAVKKAERIDMSDKTPANEKH